MKTTKPLYKNKCIECGAEWFSDEPQILCSEHEELEWSKPSC